MMTDLNKDRKCLNFSVLLPLTVLLKTLDPQIGDSLCSEMIQLSCLEFFCMDHLSKSLLLEYDVTKTIKYKINTVSLLGKDDSCCE